LSRDGELPRWLRWLAAVGLASIPGPFDEVVLLIVAAMLWLGYRERLRAAWHDASQEGALREGPAAVARRAAPETTRGRPQPVLRRRLCRLRVFGYGSSIAPASTAFRCGL
jgi:type II secretory pathway component PulL